MFVCVLIFLLLPITFLIANLEDLFSPDELSEMGIQLGNPSVELTVVKNLPGVA
jgi:hypothetical protein